MSRIISIVNQKGGVGKTTTSINLASSLAQLKQRVLLIDMDPQGNTTSGLGVDLQKVTVSMYQALVQNMSLNSVIVKTAIENLDIAPASVDLAGAAVELVPVEQREFRLLQSIQKIEDQYDFIFIDCPPSLGILTVNGIVGAKEILIPVQAEYYALEGLGQLLQTIALVKQHLKPDLEILGAVLTMFDKRNKLSEAVFRDIYQYFPNTVFKTVIPRNVRLAEAPSFGQPITTYDPHSKGGKAYWKLAKEVLYTTTAMNSRSQLNTLSE
ncbi:MAG: hypothetical protein A2233_05565 [Candidatus Kerfeldbacteria bacterium RIFOXYA2_FULL_38_24]|uniref:AAA domain-containing protein n=1 Tax=Candidatus Kerfeldbacteria bacterium RIFOXYB2_FULL_38_14 TaxID=1798547 RepID=A0A1G2BGJ8_9BACT|nr:MAG: hypothetical protein A2233_05565 [Candidatus Kerfeldbacteria bacterium RIFOXYA2_FULL_38_24]OGY88294.1 MAG: hypothetical protein A2319_03850 [Candidatus Kerfeldbacteria bacterium RIFOXYB2_FULL_38_14]